MTTGYQPIQKDTREEPRLPSRGRFSLMAIPEAGQPLEGRKQDSQDPHSKGLTPVMSHITAPCRIVSPTLKSHALHLFIILSSPNPVATTYLFTLSIVLPLLECHIVVIIQHIAFSD